MKSIRFLPEWHSYPLWIYDGPDYRKSELIGPCAPDELKTYPEILANLDKIYETYDQLFINNNVEFRYKGFDNESDKQNYINLVTKTLAQLHEALDNRFIIVDDTRLNDL
jgi:hypothetical protein